MDLFIPSTFLPESVQVSPSKSFAQRYLIAAALNQNQLLIKRVGNSDDVKNVQNIIQNLGADLEKTESGIKVNPDQKRTNFHFNIGESGLAMRLILPISAVLSNHATFNGKGTLNNREFENELKFLTACGLKVVSQNSKLPIQISGRLKGGKYSIDGGAGSQFISGLLMALPLCDEDSTLTVKRATSVKYIDMTLKVLLDFGIKIQQIQDTDFIIPGNQTYQNIKPEFSIEGDYSGAANWLVAGALSSNGINLKGLNKNSLQADASILSILENYGAILNWSNEDLTVLKKECNPINFDATNCPDLFPSLVVLAAGANGLSKIKGISRLYNKESNRAEVLVKEFSKAGLKIELEDDHMLIYGTGKLKSCTIYSNDDHRIAMAGAIASTLTSEGITVSGAEAVTKSYPEFWQHAGIV